MKKQQQQLAPFTVFASVDCRRTTRNVLISGSFYMNMYMYLWWVGGMGRRGTRHWTRLLLSPLGAL